MPHDRFESTPLYTTPTAAQQAPVQEPVAWPCVIAEADFEKNTVTLEMQCSDYKVGAGRHWLHTTPPAQPAPVQSCYCLNCEALGKELAALKAQPAPVQEPVTLRPEDVTVEVLTVQGGGGFAPLRTHGVKLTHKPTGIVVQCSSERSQHRNREQALRDLERYLHGARPQPTPPAAPVQPVPIKPVVDPDLEVNQRLAFKLGWKSAEEAHGITKGQP
jgi:hypothetical protein